MKQIKPMRHTHRSESDENVLFSKWIDFVVFLLFCFWKEPEKRKKLTLNLNYCLFSFRQSCTIRQNSFLAEQKELQFKYLRHRKRTEQYHRQEKQLILFFFFSIHSVVDEIAWANIKREICQQKPAHTRSWWFFLKRHCDEKVWAGKRAPTSHSQIYWNFCVDEREKRTQLNFRGNLFIWRFKMCK